MKNFSCILAAALLAIPTVMSADVTVSLHVRNGSGVNIQAGDLLGTQTTALSYDETTGVYSITNFLGYEKGNLNFTIDKTEKFTGANSQERFPLIFSVPEGSIIKEANSAKTKWQFVTTDIDIEEEEINLEDFYDLDSGVFTGNDDTDFKEMKLVDSNLWGVCEETSAAAFDNVKVRSFAVATETGYEFTIEVQSIGIRYSYGTDFTYNDYPEDDFGFGLNFVAVFPDSASESAVEFTTINADKAEYFNLQGVRVENPAAGLYIKTQGGKAQKVIIR